METSLGYKACITNVTGLNRQSRSARMSRFPDTGKSVNGKMVKRVGAGGMVKMLKPTGLGIDAIGEMVELTIDKMASSKMVKLVGKAE